MKYLLGIDIGTSSTKVVLFDNDLNVIAQSSSNYDIQQVHSLWAEQDPKIWWDATCYCLKEIMNTGINPEDILSIGLSGQMHGLVMLDENNQPIRPSIIWCDQRTFVECDELTARVGYDELVKITGNRAMLGFTASKILWVKNNEKEVFAKCRKILLPKDYIRYCLTGEFATEVSDASGMQLMDITSKQWSKILLDTVGITTEMLPKIFESHQITGCISNEAHKITGLLNTTAVVGGAGDQAASAIGNGIIDSKRISITIGSSGVVFAQTDNLVMDRIGRVQTFCHAIEGKYHVMGVTQAAGTSMKWAKDQFCYEEKLISEKEKRNVYDIINERIEKILPGSNGLIYLPYLLGERTPHLDNNARGVFFGLTNQTRKDHIMRSVMEGISYSLLDGYQIISELTSGGQVVYLSGGGSKSDVWSQMIADIFNKEVIITNVSDAGTVGCAILAGVGIGLFPSIENACHRLIKNAKIYYPKTRNVAIYKQYFEIYKALYESLKIQFENLGRINQNE